MFKNLKHMLKELALDNGLTRTSWQPEDDCDRAYAELEMTAAEIIQSGLLEDFVAGEHLDQLRIIEEFDAQDLSDWLERCFQGDLFELYFEI